MDFNKGDSLKTEHFYTVLLCLWGIRTKLLDFHGVTTNRNYPTDQPLKNTLLKLLSAVIFIAFVSQYPTLISSIISNWPFGRDRKKIEHVILYIHFCIKYVVVIGVWVLELFTEKSINFYQHEIERDLLQLKSIHSHWSIYSKKRKLKTLNWHDSLINLSILTKKRCLGIFLMMFSFISFNSIRYLFVFNGDEREHFYDIIFGNVPNLFIALFVLHSTEIIIQHKKVFHLLNELVDVVASDVGKHLLSHTTKGSEIEYFTTINKRHLHTATKHIATLMENHNRFRMYVIEVRKIQSMQMNAVILNDFLNIIFEVSSYLFIS